MLDVFRLSPSELSALELALEQYIQNSEEVEARAEEEDEGYPEAAEMAAARKMQDQLAALRAAAIERGAERERMLKLARG